jgi:hypothetical protein
VPEGDLERVTGGVTLRDGSLVARENECEEKREREREREKRGNRERPKRRAVVSE